MSPRGTDCRHPRPAWARARRARGRPRAYGDKEVGWEEEELREREERRGGGAEQRCGDRRVPSAVVQREDQQAHARACRPTQRELQ